MNCSVAIQFLLCAVIIKTGQCLVLGDRPNSSFGESAGEAALAQVQTFAGDSSQPETPYEEKLPREEPYNYKTVVQAPALAINTAGLLAPHIEILKLVETFLQLKQQGLARLNALVNDNYDLIRAVIQLLSSKISGLTTFTLKGVAILRRIMEFALELFGQWTITLPTVAVGGGYTGYSSYGVPAPAPAPVPAYGVPAEPTNFHDYLF